MVAMTLKGHTTGAPSLLNLPWDLPLADWPDDNAIKLPRGRHRHIVRFIELEGEFLALKELPGRYAEIEYENLEFLDENGLPVVELVGIVTGRLDTQGAPLDSILITSHLAYSLPYLHLFATPSNAALFERIIDALAVLLVRLHLSGFFWGDCSLGNALFRRDAGSLMAYIVDTETSETHDTLSDGQRQLDIDIACDNIAGGLYELEAMGKLPPDVDPAHVVETLHDRYHDLWSALTDTQYFDADALWHIQRRVTRLNELGFDTIEFELQENEGRRSMAFRPRVVEEGHHRRELLRLTGITAQENQARRLLSMLYGYGAWLGESEGAELPVAVQAYRWLTERYQAALDSIPDELRSRLDDAEIYHQILDHLWFMSERAGTNVGLFEATADYVATVLPLLPDERAVVGIDDESESIVADLTTLDAFDANQD